MNLEEGYQANTQTEKGVLDATTNPYIMAVKKEVKDQFMVGPSLLVAPLFAGDEERQVILPQGKWYDFYTGEFAGEGEVITVSPGLSKIPVYVKEGGIIPLWPVVTKVKDEKLPLEVHHYGKVSSSYNLYDDDGKSFDYDKGDFSRIVLRVDVDTNGNKTGKAIIPEEAEVWSFSDYNFHFMTDKYLSV